MDDFTDEVGEVLQGLMRFQWISEGYGQYHCSSCGARRTMDWSMDQDNWKETKEPCSIHCPWQRARNLLEEST